MPAAFAHSPGFVLRHGLQMLAHTFTGTTVRSVLGLEDERTVFARYRDRRRRVRENLMPDPALAPRPSTEEQRASVDTSRFNREIRNAPLAPESHPRAGLGRRLH
jgi:hypothetical protein